MVTKPNMHLGFISGKPQGQKHIACFNFLPKLLILAVYNLKFKMVQGTPPIDDGVNFFEVEFSSNFHMSYQLMSRTVIKKKKKKSILT